MRTTLTLEDDVFVAAKALAEQLGISLGAAVSRLARQGLRSPQPKVGTHGLPVFDVPADAPVIPVHRAGELLGDEGLE